jgi:hypothetical protein
MVIFYYIFHFWSSPQSRVQSRVQSSVYTMPKLNSNFPKYEANLCSVTGAKNIKRFINVLFKRFINILFSKKHCSIRNIFYKLCFWSLSLNSLINCSQKIFFVWKWLYLLRAFFRCFLTIHCENQGVVINSRTYSIQMYVSPHTNYVPCTHSIRIHCILITSGAHCILITSGALCILITSGAILDILLYTNYFRRHMYGVILLKALFWHCISLKLHCSQPIRIEKFFHVYY